MTGPPRLAAERGWGLEAAAVSEQGPVRARNEDRFVLELERGVFAVIDGMGGEGGGDVAADLAAGAVRGTLDPEHALDVAHAAIRERAAADPALARMGAVASLAVLGPEGARIHHVGDTRAWRVAEGGTVQLTEDHVVDVEDGQGVTRTVIARDLGAGPLVEGRVAASSDVVLAPRDLLVLASDGVYGAIPRVEWEQRLDRARRDGTPVDRLVRELVALALALGSADNATVLVVRTAGPAGGFRDELRRWWTGPEDR